MIREMFFLRNLKKLSSFGTGLSAGVVTGSAGAYVGLIGAPDPNQTLPNILMLVNVLRCGAGASASHAIRMHAKDPLDMGQAFRGASLGLALGAAGMAVSHSANKLLLEDTPEETATQIIDENIEGAVCATALNSSTPDAPACGL